MKGLIKNKLYKFNVIEFVFLVKKLKYLKKTIRPYKAL